MSMYELYKIFKSHKFVDETLEKFERLIRQNVDQELVRIVLSMEK